MRRVVLLSLLLAGGSLLIVPPAPSYDPWAWLLWGREVLGGDLSTDEGPAFKPLPVAVCTALALLGVGAPAAWVLVARAGTALALCLAFRLGRRWSGTVAGGVLAAAGVALSGALLAEAASGSSEGLLLGAALASVEAARTGRARTALACAVACALLRVETWPFLALAGACAWRTEPRLRAPIAAAAVLVPAAWFVPELLGSGQLLRSAARARIPNPGQPALADLPAWASLRAAAALPLWPLWASAVLVVARAGRGVVRAVPAVAQRCDTPAAAVAVGAAWIALVAGMSQLGFSGEPRYAVPGAALVALGGAVGLAGATRALPRWPGPVAAVLLLALLPAAAPRLAGLVQVHREQAYQWRLQSDLTAAFSAAGGRDAVLACGVPFVGPLRGPLSAYRLDVAKHLVEPDLPPRAPGVVFSSALHAGSAVAPDVPPGFSHVARVGLWDVHARCIP